MAGSTVNSEASLQFRTLREHWKRHGYPHIDGDLAEVFKAISQDIRACNGERIQAGPKVEVYKYRQNSKDIRRGARYGWRVICFYYKPTGTMYPIIVFPKQAWADAGSDVIKAAINEIRQILGHCISPGCDGLMSATDPPETATHGESVHTKMKCGKCGSIQWAPA